MTWLLDLGNTRLKWAALAADGDVTDVRALAHAEPDFQAQLARLLANTRPDDPVWLASVAPPATTYAVRAQLLAHGLQVLPVLVSKQCAGMRIGYREPAQLGVDRFLALLATTQLPAEATLLVSVGSAMTIDLIDSQRVHRGGLIAPTPEHLRQAMAARFPGLTAASEATGTFADSTADAVAFGCLGSALGLIERSFREAVGLLGVEPAIILTGGGADQIAAQLALAHTVRAHWVLAGLACYVHAQPRVDAPPV